MYVSVQYIIYKMLVKMKYTTAALFLTYSYSTAAAQAQRSTHFQFNWLKRQVLGKKYAIVAGMLLPRPIRGVHFFYKCIRTISIITYNT